MKKMWVICTLSLALAGCAHTRSALTKDDKGPPKEPISVGSVPSIHDTVNRGTGGTAIARTTMKDPANPQWDGRVKYPGGDTSAAGSNVASQSSAATAATAPAGAAMMAAPGNQPMMPASPGSEMAATPPSLASPEAASAVGAPLGLEPASGPAPGTSPARPTMIAPTPIVGAGPAAIEPAATSGSRSVTNQAQAHVEAIDMPPISRLPATPPPTDTAVSPSTGAEPLSPAPATAAKSAASKADPLLGPDPDVMPSMPDLDSIKPAAIKPSATKPAAAKTATATATPASASTGLATPSTAPASEGPALEPGSSGPPLELTPVPVPPAASDLPELPPLPEPGSTASRSSTTVNSVELSSASSLPAAAGKLESAGVVEQAPATGRSLAGAEPKSRASEPAPAAAALRISPPRDSHVVQASADPFAALVEPAPRKLGKQAGKPLARVGDEIITSHDLIVATREVLARYGNHGAADFNSSEQLEWRKQREMVAKYTLDNLIERSILVQEAKHAIKDSKQLDKMMEMADRVWKDEQLPVLERQFAVDTEHLLKEKLTERGRSLDVMKSNFKQDFLAQGFLQDRLKDKLRIELPEELKYYNDHMHDRDFHRPAQITWRELVVETARHPDKASARRKIEVLARRLRQGEDFAKLARAESEGPGNVRDQGGLMQTSPGSYAVSSVNEALGSLAIGANSGVLEGPTSFHIVRVENRRAAGPASFEEVRAQIRPKLAEEKFRTERAAFLKKLRDRTLVSTVYDAAASPIGVVGK